MADGRKMHELCASLRLRTVGGKRTKTLVNVTTESDVIMIL